jgi:uncharacterized protein
MIEHRHGIDIGMDALAEICQRFHVRELSSFGSFLRDDFREDSDVDVLVEYEPGARVSLFDMSDLKFTFEGRFQRKVDLGEKAGLKPLVRDHILVTSRVLITV